jgi:hypothetical protein
MPEVATWGLNKRSGEKHVFRFLTVMETDVETAGPLRTCMFIIFSGNGMVEKISLAI